MATRKSLRSAYGRERERSPFASPETGYKGQSQERQHSAAVIGEVDGDAGPTAPARGTISLARGIVTRRAETRHPALVRSAGLGERSE